MSDTALMIFTGPIASVELAPTAHERRALLLAESSQIEAVTTPLEQAEAAKVASELQGLLKGSKKAHDTMKRPVLDLGNRIGTIFKDFVGQPQEEYDRIMGLIGVFQNAENQRVEEENRRRAEAIVELQAKERVAAAEAAAKLAEAAAAEAKLNNPSAGAVELDKAVAAEAVAAQATAVAVQTATAATNAIYAPLPQVQKASGMAVKRTPTVVVKDLAALFAHNPALVRMELNRSALNELLYEGAEFPGLDITWGVAVSVRA